MPKTRSSGDSAAQRNRRIHHLSPAMRVETDVLLFAASHQCETGAERRALDVDVHAFALHVADRAAAHVAAVLAPAPGDFAPVGSELADQIEFVAVAVAAQLQVDLALA